MLGWLNTFVCNIVNNAKSLRTLNDDSEKNRKKRNPELFHISLYCFHYNRICVISSSYKGQLPKVSKSF